MRSHYCGLINDSLIDQTITLCGWVDRRRDHGGVIFLDLRDREGVVQVVFDPDTEEHFQRADSVRSEYVLRITGRVRARSVETVNPNMASGGIEVLGKTLEVLNTAQTPPFPLDAHHSVGEDVRLRYRYMDLRRPEMQQNLIARAKITSSIRRYLDDHGFLDIETPILTRATPEGARDYLVPSRTQPGAFLRSPSRLSCLSNCSWCQDLTAIIRSHGVFVTKISERTGNLSLPRSILKPPFLAQKRSCL